MKTKKAWKKGFRKVPDWIADKAASSTEDQLVVSGVKRVRRSEIEAGHYFGIGISLGPDGPTLSDLVIPPAEGGRYSRRNLEGYEVIRRDLPKVPKTISFEAPNWGDWSKGSHDVTYTRMVYARDFVGPKELQMRVELIGQEVAGEPVFVFRFTVDTILDRTHTDFSGDLLYSLCILQENTGIADIYPCSAQVEEYLNTEAVGWEILPVGEEALPLVIKLVGGTSEQAKGKIMERYQVFRSLNPKSLIAGTSGLRRYFGALIHDSLVVFENVDYGNALYVMFDEWRTLSQLSRSELLSGTDDGFVRIVHRKGWEEALRKAVGGSGCAETKHAA